MPLLRPSSHSEIKSFLSAKSAGLRNPSGHKKFRTNYLSNPLTTFKFLGSSSSLFFGVSRMRGIFLNAG